MTKAQLLFIEHTLTANSGLLIAVLSPNRGWQWFGGGLVVLGFVGRLITRNALKEAPRD